MTGRERILAAFCGEKADFVPFSPNIYQWFYHHRTSGALPAEIADAQHPFDVLRHLGADILARWDTQPATQEVYTRGEFLEEYGGQRASEQPLVTAFNRYPAHRCELRQKFVTPYGMLTQTWRLSPKACADFIEEFWWKTWDDYPAVRFMLEMREYAFDDTEFHRWVERVGEDGVMMANITQSPLKTFHWLSGPENASLFIIDHPEEMKALARIHEEKALALLRFMVDIPEIEIFIALDDLDAAFYSPSFYAEYCGRFFSRAAEIIHCKGKTLVVHACGRNRVLLPLVGRSGVDCLEGITPPPLGDVELVEVRKLAGQESYTVNGGMDATHQEITDNAEPRLHDYTHRLFDSMGDRRHFIFASSCNTSPLTPWRNLVYFRDAAREYGRID